MTNKTIRNLLGACLLFGASIAIQAQNNVTFQVNMNSFTNSTGGKPYSLVDVRGAFNGWGAGSTLVDNGSGVYTNTFSITGNPADTSEYKFTFTSPSGVNWEDSQGGTNRLLTLVGGNQVLPVVPFYAPSIPTPLEFVTNQITFKVDMRVQGPTFINGGGVVTVSGAYNGWGNGDTLTNDPSLAYPSNWVYSGTFTAVYQRWFTNFTLLSRYNNTRYKFRANGGWEEPTFNPLYGTDDRSFDAAATGPTLVLPAALYSDASLCDVIPQDTTATFAVHIPNGTIDTSGHVFDKNVDSVYINGESLLGVWQLWNVLLPQMYPAGNDIYTNTFVIPAGRPRNQKVKYGINGGDNEAPQFDDHIQWIRSTNAVVTMSTVEFGTNYESTRVQSRFGDLKAGAPVAGQVPITWSGCSCVTLQSTTNVSSGQWTDMPATEGQSATNFPVTSGTHFYRLQDRPNP